jgi:hypothetical protein
LFSNFKRNRIKSISWKIPTIDQAKKDQKSRESRGIAERVAGTTPSAEEKSGLLNSLDASLATFGKKMHFFINIPPPKNRGFVPGHATG